MQIYTPHGLSTHVIHTHTGTPIAVGRGQNQMLLAGPKTTHYKSGIMSYKQSHSARVRDVDDANAICDGGDDDGEHARFFGAHIHTGLCAA